MSAIEDIETSPVFLEKITIDGIGNYADDYINSLLKTLVASPVKTVGELKKETDKVISDLNYLGCFTNVNASYDLAKNTEKKYDQFGEPLINVVGKIDVESLKPKNFSFKTIHNESGHAFAFNFINRNLFGNATTFQLDSIVDLLTNTKSLDLFASTPIFNSSLKLFSKINVSKQPNSPYQCKNDTSIIELGLIKQKYCTKSGSLSNIVTGLNITNRNISNIEDSANDEVKLYAGTSLKESLFLNFNTSNMKYLVKSKCTLPTEGFTISCNNELTGLPNNRIEDIDLDSSNDKFYKFGLNVDLAKSTKCHNVSFLSNFKFGTIVNLNNSESPIHFDEKFYPLVSGYTKPIMPYSSIGSGSFLSYNFGINSKFFFVDIEQPLRLFANINGSTCSNELSGFKLSNLGQFNEYWKHGIDFGLLYNNGETIAKVYWSKPLDDLASSNNIGKVGFEVDVTGIW